MPIIYSTKPLQPRKQFDHYPTPSGLVRAILSIPCIRPRPRTILDPGSGTGVFGAIARTKYTKAIITGIECQPSLPNKNYNHWVIGDMFRWSARSKHQKFDLIIGNPPYGGICKDMAEMFVRTCLSHLGNFGQVVFLLRSAFLEGIERGRNFFQEFRPHTIYQCMRRPSFTGNAKTDSTAYSVFIWNKNENPDYSRTFHLDWEYGEPIEEDKPFKPLLLLGDYQ